MCLSRTNLSRKEIAVNLKKLLNSVEVDVATALLKGVGHGIYGL